MALSIVGSTAFVVVPYFDGQGKWQVRQALAYLSLSIALIVVCLIPGEVAGSPLPKDIEVFAITPIRTSKDLPDWKRNPNVKQPQLTIFAARGEYEPASFAVRIKGRTIDGVRLVPSNLIKTASQAEIASSSVDIRIVKRWFQSFYAWNEIGKSSPDDFRQTLVPELLLKDQSLIQVDPDGQRNYAKVDAPSGGVGYKLLNPSRLSTVEKDSILVDDFSLSDADELQPMTLIADIPQQVWVTLHVPDDAEPGEYVGQINVESGQGLLATIETRLLVYEFALLNNAPEVAIYYRGQLNQEKAGIGSEYKSLVQMRAELDDLSRHGITSPTMYQPFSNAVALDTAMSMRRESGLNRNQLFYLGVTTTDSSLGRDPINAVHNIRQIIPPILGAAQKNGLGQVYIYGRDEARGADLVAQRSLWKVVHNSGAKVVAAGYTGTYGSVGDLLDAFVHAHKPDYREALKWHRNGKKIYSYANPQAGPENPFLFRLNYGLMLWANDYDGAMLYAYQHCFGSCWSDIDHPVYRDHVVAYPTANGVIPTIAWEGFREGVDDLRYVARLEYSMRAAQKAQIDDWVEVEQFLDSTRNDLRRRQAGAGKYNTNVDVDLDAVRQAMAAYIIKLDAAVADAGIKRLP
jgi:hypothetical protein